MDGRRIKWWVFLSAIKITIWTYKQTNNKISPRSTPRWWKNSKMGSAVYSSVTSTVECTPVWTPIPSIRMYRCCQSPGRLPPGRTIGSKGKPSSTNSSSMLIIATTTSWPKFSAPSARPLISTSSSTWTDGHYCTKPSPPKMMKLFEFSSSTGSK